MVANVETSERQPSGAAAGSDEKLDQQLRTILEDVGRLAHQDDLHSGFTPRLDLEVLERKAIYDRLGAIENQTKKAKLARVHPLPARYLYWCCSHLGLAILRRGSQTAVRDKGSGAWMVVGDQADDRELGGGAWLDEAAGHSRKHCCSVIRDGDAASGTCSANSASGGRAERARRPFHRPGGGASNSDGPNRAAANRGADHRQSRPDGARGR